MRIAGKVYRVPQGYREKLTRILTERGVSLKYGHFWIDRPYGGRSLAGAFKFRPENLVVTWSQNRGAVRKLDKILDGLKI